MYKQRPPVSLFPDITRLLELMCENPSIPTAPHLHNVTLVLEVPGFPATPAEGPRHNSYTHSVAEALFHIILLLSQQWIQKGFKGKRSLLWWESWVQSRVYESSLWLKDE